ncbi:MAG: hypothetical protein AAFU55_17610, partial [Pseudomonadota bacterium]
AGGDAIISFRGTTIRLDGVGQDEISANDFRFPGGGDNRKAVKPASDNGLSDILFRDNGGDLL